MPPSFTSWATSRVVGERPRSKSGNTVAMPYYFAFVSPASSPSVAPVIEQIFDRLFQRDLRRPARVGRDPVVIAEHDRRVVLPESSRIDLDLDRHARLGAHQIDEVL